MANEDTKPIHQRALELVEELENVMAGYGVDEAMLYQIATDESRKEYFLKMFKLLQEYTA